VSVRIREERPGDADAVRAVHERAFGRPHEGRLVDLLRQNEATMLSLVAVADGKVVGHIYFSAVLLGPGDEEVVGSGLAPMAVLPELQRTGIGTTLVATAIQMLRVYGCPFIVVLGHPRFYTRFGFVPASRHGVACQWDVPDEAFMMLPLDAATLRGVRGTAQYRDEFIFD
jgi:putative acetyltransferase